MKKIFTSTAAAIFVFGALAAFFNFYFTDPAGVDGYYHIRHAWIYSTQGIFSSDFSWLRYSVVGQWGADIWYGFHILLIPFSLFGNIFTGLRSAAALITFAALAGFYFIFKKLEIRWPFFWTLFFFFSVPDVNFRLLMVRPHILTFILTLALFYALTKERSNKLIFILSAGVAFIHLAMIWLPLGLVILIVAIKRMIEDRWQVKKGLAAAAGIVVGWLARPEPISAIKLAYIQTIRLAVEKFNRTPLRFGTELKPGNSLSVVVNEIIPILFLVVMAAAGLIWLIKKHSFPIEKNRQVILIGSLIMSVVFGLITYGAARRAADVWVGFSFIFAGIAFSIVVDRYADFFARSKIKLAALAAIILVGFSVNTLRFTLGYFKNLPPINAFKESAVWLKENTGAGDIVFNIHWDNFPFLFFWNQHNRYINGMDPIFEYAFDKGLYLKHYFLEIDKILMIEGEAYTCGSNPCAPGAVTPVSDVLKKDFGADYVFLELPRNPKVYEYLDSNKMFKKVFNNGREIIFQVL